MIDILRHGFVQNAFLAGVIVAIISGFVGYFVVLRGQAFACEALSHIGFAGALGAALVGASSLEGCSSSLCWRRLGWARSVSD